MSHLNLLGSEVERVVLLRCNLNRHALGDLYAEAVQTVNLLRIIGQQAQLLRAEVLQDLSADPVFAQVGRKAELYVCFNGIEALFLQLIRLQLVDQTDAAAFLAHIE